MSSRRGVVLVMFDLPMLTKDDRRCYAAFRKKIHRRGYGMFQRSVYCRLLRNIASARQEVNWLRGAAPEEGEVQALVLNLNEFRGLTAIRGIGFDMALFSDDAVFIGDDTEEEAPEMDDATLLRRCEELAKRTKKEDREDAPEDENEEEEEEVVPYHTDLF